MEKGVLVPQGLSVSGVGDGEFSRHGVVPLTSVRFPSLGRLGFELWKKGREDDSVMKTGTCEGGVDCPKLDRKGLIHESQFTRPTIYEGS